MCADDLSRVNSTPASSNFCQKLTKSLGLMPLILTSPFVMAAAIAIVPASK